MTGDKRLKSRDGSQVTVWKMTNLLFVLRGQDCEHVRDRVYSLRSFARDGQRFVVDYSASDVELLHQLLRPLRPSLCFCSLEFIIQSVLGFGMTQTVSDPHRFPMVKLTMTKTALVEKPQRDWIIFFKTPPVCRACGSPVKVDESEELLLCLGERCSERARRHIIVKKDLSSVKDDPRSGHCPVFEVAGAKVTQRETKIDLSMHLDQWIKIALFTRNREIGPRLCQTVVGGHHRTACFGQALEHTDLSQIFNPDEMFD